jgi:hypothetical protein
MLTPTRFRFSDTDRAAFGCDEWLPLHMGLLVDRRWSDLRRWEAVVKAELGGMTLRELFLISEEDAKKKLDGMEAVAVVAWLSLQLNCDNAPAWDDFDPQLWAIDKQNLLVPAAGGDVDPPASSSAGTSAETPPRQAPKGSRSKRG